MYLLTHHPSFSAPRDQRTALPSPLFFTRTLHPYPSLSLVGSKSYERQKHTLWEKRFWKSITRISVRFFTRISSIPVSAARLATFFPDSSRRKSQEGVKRRTNLHNQRQDKPEDPPKNLKLCITSFHYKKRKK